MMFLFPWYGAIFIYLQYFIYLFLLIHLQSTTNVHRDEVEITDEKGEFCDIADDTKIIMSYWTKHNMAFIDDMNVTTFISLLNHTYGSFHFNRKKTDCLGMNVYDGQCIVLF